MRVAKYYSNSDLRIEETLKPKIGKGEVLVQVEASGICGSDVMEWYRKDRVPLVLGHEIAGCIVEAGEGVTGFKVGDRVAVSHHVPCYNCDYCRNGYHTVCDTLRKTNFEPGGFAEYVRVPNINVQYGTYLLPDSVSYELATFIEPLACVLRAQRVANIKPAQSILVIGSGIAGILHIHLAARLGAGNIIATDICQWRLKKAKDLGADATLDAKDYSVEKLRELNCGKLADVVMLCTQASSAIRQAFLSVERSGTIVFFAPTDKDREVQLPVNELFWRAERKLVSSYAGSPQDHLDALELIKLGRLELEGMITHRLPFKDIGLGFKLVAEAGESLKVIIKPQE
ncbi:MAG: alcohol dehydrogenase catalytic domain-containing protein [Candidatus Omnitrophota bacterium]